MPLVNVALLNFYPDPFPPQSPALEPQITHSEKQFVQRSEDSIFSSLFIPDELDFEITHDLFIGDKSEAVYPPLQAGPVTSDKHEESSRAEPTSFVREGHCIHYDTTPAQARRHGRSKHTIISPQKRSPASEVWTIQFYCAYSNASLSKKKVFDVFPAGCFINCFKSATNSLRAGRSCEPFRLYQSQLQVRNG